MGKQVDLPFGGKEILRFRWAELVKVLLILSAIRRIAEGLGIQLSLMASLNGQREMTSLVTCMNWQNLLNSLGCALETLTYTYPLRINKGEPHLIFIECK